MKQTVAFSKNARNVFFHILTQCNLKCRHCYINPAEHGTGMLPLATIEDWLRTLYDPQKPANVIFLGGEPTLHPDLSGAIKAARSIGYQSVTIDTNGYLFHDILDKVTPEEVDFISFSLDGPESAVNDPIRGKGSYETCVAGIRRAVEKGFKVSVIYTVQAGNLEFLEKMPDLLARLGVDRFFIQVIGLRGNAAVANGVRQVTRARWEKTVPEVARQAAQLGLTVTYPKVYLGPEEEFACAGKVAENFFLFPNGRVYRCPLCEDYPLHSLCFGEEGLTPTGGINEERLFELTIPEGCVMNRLVQPENIERTNGRPASRIACCLLKEEITPDHVAIKKRRGNTMEGALYQDAMGIFKAGLAAANPAEAVTRAVRLEPGEVLRVGEKTFNLADYDRVLVVGAGKAACPMAKALEDILEGRIATGAVTTKYGHTLPLSAIEVTEAGHPVPDTRGLTGVRNITGLLESAKERDLVFCLLSGGGSALLPLPAEGITLHEKQKTTSALLASGANIHEINAVRKHISQVKGGGLARIAHPATVVTLLLSDVIGDDPDVIASGPTVPDPSTYADCVGVINRYHLKDRIPRPVWQHLLAGANGERPETPKPGDPAFEKGFAQLVGSSRQTLNAAGEEARRLGYNTFLLSSVVEGESREVAKVHAAVVKEILSSGNPIEKPACVLSGGETTVTVKGTGKGGRNTEFVLAAARMLAGLKNLMVVSCGTDGTDGPTDAAGAAADGTTIERADKQGLDPAKFLENNDSYTFFETLGDLVKTGPTRTNVMDLRILLVK